MKFNSFSLKFFILLSTMFIFFLWSLLSFTVSFLPFQVIFPSSFSFISDLSLEDMTGHVYLIFGHFIFLHFSFLIRKFYLLLSFLFPLVFFSISSFSFDLKTCPIHFYLYTLSLSLSLSLYLYFFFPRQWHKQYTLPQHVIAAANVNLRSHRNFLPLA